MPCPLPLAMQLKLFSHWDAHDERPTGVLCVKDLHLLRSCDFWASLDQRSKGIQRFRFSTLTGDFECPKNLETLEPFAFSSVASGHQLFDVLCAAAGYGYGVCWLFQSDVHVSRLCA